MYGFPHRGVQYRHAKHDTWTDGSKFSLRSSAAAEGEGTNAYTHTHVQLCARFFFFTTITSVEACGACCLTVCFFITYILLLEQLQKDFRVYFFIYLQIFNKSTF